MQETPTISGSSYSSTTMGMPMLYANATSADALTLDELTRQFGGKRPPAIIRDHVKEIDMAAASARIVKVFIADPNENLPLEKRVIFSGPEKLTDLTDQELFYEVSIGDLLIAHNEVRKATVDKSQAEKFGRDIHLEPARIRDLKMVVVTIAQF